MILHPCRGGPLSPARHLGPPPAPGEGAPPEAPWRRSGAALAGPASLLIVEDDWFIGAEIEAAAQAAGYRIVDIVATAERAVAAALEHLPDLALMDIRLAGARDGVDAALEIRRRADIPSLFVSAHQDPEVRLRAEAARPAGWLSKPFTDAQLLGAIRQALATSRPGG